MAVKSPNVEPLSPADVTWLRMDAPENPMVITALLTFSKSLGYPDLERFVEERFLPFVRFRQRLVPA